ncbi:methyltransferase family protein [Candidatus Oscillochloris fontis]|uniref:methyltransferase family protein n=1 Tax=Candidatus Oscillochloris fontis TaxID=2496868 RepID=UPI00101BDC07|nr:methyltransferase [Candidatus Oscillochloris fontis]
MITLIVGLLGLVVFFLATIVFGRRLRQQPSKIAAEETSRIMHFLFFAGLGLPFMISIFYPGINKLDFLVGFSPLPMRPLFILFGLIIAIPGLYFLSISNRKLRALGSGANAFRLTQRVVVQDVYRMTRNPMSFGYYLSALSLSLITGSTLLTLYTLFGIIPVHIFFLKYFEEYELELRLGDSYRTYKTQVPFLLPSIGRR